VSRKQFSNSTTDDPAGTAAEAEDSGSEASDTDDARHATSSHRPPSVPQAQNPTGGKDTEEGSIIVAREIADLACREVLRQLSSIRATVVKRPQDLTPASSTAKGTTLKAPLLPGEREFAQFKACSGIVCALCTALQEPLSLAPSISVSALEDAPTTKSSSQPQKKSPRALQGAIAATATEPMLLLDNLSSDRISQFLDLFSKLLAVCSKESGAVARQAEHLRKVATMVEAMRQLGGNGDDNDGFASSRERSSRMPSSARSAAAGEYFEDSDFDSVEAENADRRRQLNETFHRLSKASTHTSSSVLFGFLAAMPLDRIIHLRAWLERRIRSCPKHPRGDVLVQVKRCKAAVNELDTFQEALRKLLNVTERRPRQVRGHRPLLFSLLPS
jgi:hypothetical protein